MGGPFGRATGAPPASRNGLPTTGTEVRWATPVARWGHPRWRAPSEWLRADVEHDKEREITGPDWRDNSLVFNTPTGRPLDPTNLTRRFRSFLDRARLRPIRIHDLRRLTAPLLLEQGVDLVVIKELLGHAHIGVTVGVYAHLRLRLQRDAIDALGHALGGQDGDPDDQPVTAVVR
ncbi:tyrosine-type recombinase/integrase [Streptomyces sp. NPDC057638]|uniref:tyrosine-type recombinase/integrase n=1 Tax=Streptomyces sp. NPDC057638 TaxID=3346190 RepID=UPI0036B94048